MRPETVFLDRDGTLNVKAPEGDYITSPEGFRWMPGAREAVRLLSEAGVRVIVVTNQRGIALGRMTEDDLSAIHRRMLDDLDAADGRVAGIYHCPHDAEACDCRKPEVGMFLQAQRDFPEIRFDRSAVIGDSRSDMLAARRLGATAVYVGDPDSLAAAEGIHGEACALAAARWLLDGGREGDREAT
jgi:D-glycero-D-manno-heptose 1,7-bisphosphate phosphatase